MKGRIRAHSHGKRRGFTVVELVMSLAIFSIGITGAVAMQTVTARTNMHASRLAVATSHARSWLDRLAMDGGSWGGAGAWQITNTRWLTNVTAQNNVWTLPVMDADTTFGPAADARGGFVNHLLAPADVVFCTHVRLTRLVNDPGSGLIRSEVRVFWPKQRAAWRSGANLNYCRVNPAEVLAIGAATDEFHWVYDTSLIRETPAF